MFSQHEQFFHLPERLGVISLTALLLGVFIWFGFFYCNFIVFMSQRSLNLTLAWHAIGMLSLLMLFLCFFF